jgi:hypothetical protein
MHGYVARWGFGITLIRNQTVEEIPNAIKIILAAALFRKKIFTLFKKLLIPEFIAENFIKDNPVFEFIKC